MKSLSFDHGSPQIINNNSGISLFKSLRLSANEKQKIKNVPCRPGHRDCMKRPRPEPQPPSTATASCSTTPAIKEMMIADMHIILIIDIISYHRHRDHNCGGKSAKAKAN